jgi:AraC-like DNA-binding protein
MAQVYGISVALLRPFAELLGRLDIDSAAFLNDLGIDAGALPNTYIAGELVDARLDELARSRGDRAFALTLARAAVIRPLGLFGHMVWLSGTVRDAITRAAKFYAMVSSRATLTLDETPPRATLRQHAVPGVVYSKTLTEFAFASLALRARGATGGKFELTAVSFTHAGEPSARARYRAAFGAPVEFEAKVDELAFEVDQLDLVLETADEVTSAALETTISKLTTARPHSVLVDRVRRAVTAGAETYDSVADKLGTSARTLRRQLEHEGQSLRAIADELRRERADELLAAAMPIKEVAFALGFSEPSAFSRAYKRWTGKAPKLGRVK